MSQGILVFIEHRDGAITKTSIEAITATQSLGAQLQQTVSAVVLGSGTVPLRYELPNAVAQQAVAQQAVNATSATHADATVPPRPAPQL